MSTLVLRAAARSFSSQVVIHPFRARPAASLFHQREHTEEKRNRKLHNSAPVRDGTKQERKESDNDAPAEDTPEERKKKELEALHNRDERIPFRVVRLVDRETGRLGDFAALSDILQNIDHKKQYVELVSLKPDPVVKIVERSEVWKKQRARTEKRKEKPPREEKEIQMSWGVSSSDLERKLSRAREELEAGHRVNVVYMPKKGQGKPTPEQMQARAAETVDLLADVSREWQPRVISRTSVILRLEGHSEPGPLTPRLSSEIRKQKKEEARLKNLERKLKAQQRQQQLEQRRGMGATLAAAEF